MAIHPVNQGHKNLTVYVVHQLIRDHRRWAVRTHTAGIGTGITVADWFVVLARFHYVNIPAVNKCKY